MPSIQIRSDTNQIVAQKTIPSGATAKIQAAYGGTAGQAADALLEDMVSEMRVKVLRILEEKQAAIDSATAGAAKQAIQANMSVEWP